MYAPVKKPLGPFWHAVLCLVWGMTFISCAGLFAMVLITCGDVALRTAGYPVPGSYDIVRVVGAITIACSLPLTTAMKGHVAIEYFFQKLNRAGRLAVDSLMRLIMIGVFLFAAYECVGYGVRFLHNSEVTSTIELPVFWVPWVMALAFGVTALVVVFHLVYPGREMVKS